MELLSLLKALSDQNNQMDMQSKVDTLQDAVFLINTNMIALDNKIDSLGYSILILIAVVGFVNIIYSYCENKNLSNRIRKLEQ